MRQVWASTSDGRPTKFRDAPGSQILTTIIQETKRHTAISAPALVIFAIPQVQENWIDNTRDPAVRQESRAYLTKLNALKERQAKAFEAAVPTARVIRLPGVHYIFLSNEPGVLREMRAFLRGLKP